MRKPSDERDRAEGGRRAVALGAVACAAAAGFVAIARASARRETAAADEKVREATAAPDGSKTREAAKKMAPAGKWWTYIPSALVAGTYVLAGRGPRDDEAERSRRVGAGAVLLAGVVATALNPAFDHIVPQPPAPPGHDSPRKPVFPSGHAFGPGAVGLTAAYVLAREGLARGEIALPIAAALPLVTAGGRMLVEKHWASDVLGGYLGAVTLASACLAAYEVTR